MAGIYIHIPFCKQACHYCDFHFSTTLGRKKELVKAIAREFFLQRNFLGAEPVETIYFGGGTPSLLDEEEMRLIWHAIEDNFDLNSIVEVTLEANPDDLFPGKLDALRSLGINRLSIGIQSFYDPHLTFMNRAHTANQAKTSVEEARSAGFRNISIDLIYGIPHPDHGVLMADLEQSLALNPEHISAYCLTIEEKTAFGKWQKMGRLKAVDEAFAADQFEMLTEALEQRGFEQYEISNFARDALYSKHNTSYWQQKKYLGVGPSAHSYNGQWRQFNVSNNSRYISSIGSGAVPFEKDELSIEDHYNEYLLTSIRTKWGTDLRWVQHQYSFDIGQQKAEELFLLQNEGLLFVLDSTLYLTKKGKLLADEITERLMIF